MSCDEIMSNAGLDNIRTEIFGIVFKNKLMNTNFDLMIIEGAYKSQYEVYFHELEILKDYHKFKYNLLEVLETNIKKIDCININSVNKNEFPNDAFQIVDEYGNPTYNQTAILSKQFAFNAINGEFVTNKVLFGNELRNVNEVNMSKKTK